MKHSLTVAAAVGFTKASAWPAYRRTLKALKHPEITQARTLETIIRGLRRCEYGQRYGLTETSRYEDFAERLPITDYDGLAEDVGRVRAGASEIFWPGRPGQWRSTSGSSGYAKDFPSRLR